MTLIIAQWGETLTTCHCAYNWALIITLLSHNIWLKQKQFLPRLKYDKSKVEEYQLALTMSLGNQVADSIGHLGADGLSDLLQQCVGAATKSTFGSKLPRGSYRKRHCHKPWFDANFRTTKCELDLWLKANPDPHVVKHKENKLKNVLKRKWIFWETARAQHMCALAKVDALLLWKKNWPRAPVIGKISVTELLEGFCGLVG